MTGAGVGSAGSAGPSAQRSASPLAFRMLPVGIVRASRVHAVAAPSRVMGIRAARKWVARCTAPGLKGYRAARRPHGAPWRDQTFHMPHSLENVIAFLVN